MRFQVYVPFYSSTGRGYHDIYPTVLGEWFRQIRVLNDDYRWYKDGRSHLGKTWLSPRRERLGV